MVEKIPADIGSIIVGKFELKYQIEGTGAPVIHSPQYKEPELFDQELLQWLNSYTK